MNPLTNNRQTDHQAIPQPMESPPQMPLLQPRTSRSQALLTEFHNDVIHGLSASHKHLPSKYFYDQRGSKLFDKICELDEYYLTRTELDIMQQHVDEMASQLSPRAMLIEFGSGSSVKSDLLLKAMNSLAVYVPIDVSRKHLQSTARLLRIRYPHLKIHPLSEDFTKDFSLPKIACSQRVVYFPGSTIGNFTMRQAQNLLHRIWSIVGQGGGLLLGVDMVKDPRQLEAAYNDPQGVTAEFNLNILRRINRELNGEFSVSQFEHRAFFNRSASRIEMHLRSRRPQTVRIGSYEFEFEKGETIRTEYSHKYDEHSLQSMLNSAGMRIRKRWTDKRQWFSILYAARE